MRHLRSRPPSRASGVEGKHAHGLDKLIGLVAIEAEPLAFDNDTSEPFTGSPLEHSVSPRRKQRGRHAQASDRHRGHASCSLHLRGPAAKPRTGLSRAAGREDALRAGNLPKRQNRARHRSPVLDHPLARRLRTEPAAVPLHQPLPRQRRRNFPIPLPHAVRDRLPRRLRDRVARTLSAAPADPPLASGSFGRISQTRSRWVPGSGVRVRLSSSSRGARARSCPLGAWCSSRTVSVSAEGSGTMPASLESIALTSVHAVSGRLRPGARAAARRACAR